MLPLVAIPTAALWIIAVILAIFNPGPIAGVSHHTYTGILFGLALVFSVVLFLLARSAEKKRTNTLNSFALPLLLAVPLTADTTLSTWQQIGFFLIVVVLMAARTLATAPHIERPVGSKKKAWYQLWN